MARDIKLDENNLLDFSTGDLVIISNADETRQSLIIRLKMFLGEWFLDTRLGLDYFNLIYARVPNLSDIKTAIIQVITDTEGVRELISYTQEIITLNGKKTLDVTFSVLHDDAETIIDINEGFII